MKKRSLVWPFLSARLVRVARRAVFCCFLGAALGAPSETILISSAHASSSSNSADASLIQRIIHKIQIARISDLNFGEASPGDQQKTINPGQQENSENASFRVTGEPYRSFFILLPAANSVLLKLGPGGPSREIQINQFQSFPANMGRLNASGESMVFVGATRDKIAANQQAGDYLGNFIVTVVY
jgi:hypothetical protein